MQLYLNLPQIPLPLENVCEQLSETDRAATVQALAQLLAKAVMAESSREENDVREPEIAYNTLCGPEMDRLRPGNTYLWARNESKSKG